MIVGNGVSGSSRQRNGIIDEKDLEYEEPVYSKYGSNSNGWILPILYAGLGGFIAMFILMLTMPKIDLPMDGCIDKSPTNEPNNLRRELVENLQPIPEQPIRTPQIPMQPQPVVDTVVESALKVEPTYDNGKFVAKYGFYIHVFKHPAAVIHQIEQLDRYFPGSPVYIMSDGGMRFDGLCQKYNCIFQYCPPANDRWHPWPFMHRIRDAAIRMNTEYLIYLEPDNTIHGPINYEPDSDAGGMKDDNPKFGVRITSYCEEHARQKDPNFKWGYTGSGLAGGSYFKTSVIKDAFSDEKIAQINWTLMRSFDSKRVFSSDFAMPIALSYSGYQYHPWKDIIQWDFKDQPNVTKYAFEHYSRGVDGGKPEYRQGEVEGWQSQRLYEEPLKVFSDYRNCEFCWNITEYMTRWGTTECANPFPVAKHCANARDCPQP